MKDTNIENSIDGPSDANYPNMAYESKKDEEEEIPFHELKRLWDNAAVLDFAKETGENRGKALGFPRGRLQGRLEKAEEMARVFKQKGMAVTLITNAIGLTIEQIEKL